MKIQKEEPAIIFWITSSFMPKLKHIEQKKNNGST